MTGVGVIPVIPTLKLLLPGGLVFCCLSHDVVAHETTHALLDGLHRYYQYQTNPDIAAFHEAFADIVALFQHFTIPAALKHTIAMDLEPEDQYNYRTAFISGFRARGIFPEDVRNLSEENLRWQPPKVRLDPGRMRKMLSSLDLTWNLSSERKQSYLRGESNGSRLWQWLQDNLSPEEVAATEADLGVYIRASDRVPKEIPTSKEGTPKLQIHSVRPARRRGRAKSER